MSALRIWRKSSGKTQEQLAGELGENSKTYSAYERGASPVPPEILNKLRAMGFSGTADQRASSIASLTREDLEKAFVDLRGYLETRFHLEPKRSDDSQNTSKTNITNQDAVILPSHVEQAWSVLAEAVDKAGADYRFMDRKALGLLVGLTAEEIARKGFSEDTRARLLARAEGFVQTSTRPSAP